MITLQYTILTYSLTQSLTYASSSPAGAGGVGSTRASGASSNLGPSPSADGSHSFWIVRGNGGEYFVGSYEMPLPK
jgi:hypothetical protein